MHTTLLPNMSLGISAQTIVAIMQYFARNLVAKVHKKATLAC